MICTLYVKESESVIDHYYFCIQIFSLFVSLNLKKNLLHYLTVNFLPRSWRSCLILRLWILIHLTMLQLCSGKNVVRVKYMLKLNFRYISEWHTCTNASTLKSIHSYFVFISFNRLSSCQGVIVLTWWV